MNRNAIVRGVLLGLLGGLAVAFVLNMIALVVAVSSERTTSIAGVVTVEYKKGSRGGFDLALNGQAGSFLVVLAGAVVGGVLSSRRQQGSTPDSSDPQEPQTS
jgi:hypothetical protein